MHHFNSDPDPAFHINVDLDPIFHFDADPVPDKAPVILEFGVASIRYWGGKSLDHIPDPAPTLQASKALHGSNCSLHRS